MVIYSLTFSRFQNLNFVFFKNQILPYFHCFDCQEAKMWPLEAHDGGMSRNFYTDEHEKKIAVF